MNVKLISIITVVYNCVESIEETIKSILLFQDYDFEYVVIDGGSTDGTLEVIKKYSDRISILVSESDKGIYDAMNKGISLSSGMFIGFINCGDKLLKLPIEEITRNSDSFINCFPVELSNGSIFIPKINDMIKLNNTLHHQGCFYKRTDDLIYDMKYKVFSDFNLNQILYKNNRKIKVFTEPVVAYHDMGGVSNNKKYSNEIFKVVRSNFGFHFQLLAWFFFKKQGLMLRLKNIF